MKKQTKQPIVSVDLIEMARRSEDIPNTVTDDDLKDAFSRYERFLLLIQRYPKHQLVRHGQRHHHDPVKDACGNALAPSQIAGDLFRIAGCLGPATDQNSCNSRNGFVTRFGAIPGDPKVAVTGRLRTDPSSNRSWFIW